MSLKIPNALHNEGLKYKKLKTPNAHPSLFKLHTLAAFIGPRGSGKTNAAVLLASKYWDDKSFNRIFIMSPTIESNRIFELLTVDPEDIFKNIHTCLADLQIITDRVKQMMEEYEQAKEYKRIYKKWLRYQKSKGPPPAVREMNLLENNNFRPGEHVARPSPLLIIDDMSHSDIYTPSKKNSFINLCLRHRHLHRCGISIFMLVQTFRSGIPKALRQNVQQFFLWPTHDMSQLQAMYEEFANLCTFEDFLDMYQRCTKERHDFMSIDLNAPDDLLRFRKCFDEMVLPKSLMGEKELKEITDEFEPKQKKQKQENARPTTRKA